MARLTPLQKLQYASVISWDRDGRSRRDDRNRMVEDHMEVVDRMAPKFVARGVDVEDLVQEGRLGLLRAAEGFDASFNVPFPAYARYWVREFMRMHVANCGHTVKVPHQTIRKYTRIEKFRVRFRSEHDRLPTESEIESSLGLSIKTQKMVAACIAAIGSESIEHEHLVEDSGPEEVDLDEIRLVRRLHAAVGSLPDDQREVVERHYNLDREGSTTIKSIARDVAASTNRVALLRDAAIASLKEVFGVADEPAGESTGEAAG